MPKELGDKLVKEEGIRLVSRYGSSECGCKSSSPFCFPINIIIISFAGGEKDMSC